MIRKLIMLLKGEDPWKKAIHDNKNMITREQLKTQKKILQVNRKIKSGEIRFRTDVIHDIDKIIGGAL